MESQTKGTQTINLGSARCDEQILQRMTSFSTKWRANEQQAGGWAPTSKVTFSWSIPSFIVISNRHLDRVQGFHHSPFLHGCVFQAVPVGKCQGMCWCVALSFRFSRFDIICMQYYYIILLLHIYFKGIWGKNTQGYPWMGRNRKKKRKSSISVDIRIFMDIRCIYPLEILWISTCRQKFADARQSRWFSPPSVLRGCRRRGNWNSCRTNVAHIAAPRTSAGRGGRTSCRIERDVFFPTGRARKAKMWGFLTCSFREHTWLRQLVLYT